MDHPIKDTVLNAVAPTEDGTLVLTETGESQLWAAMEAVRPTERQVASQSFFEVVGFLRARGATEAANRCMALLVAFAAHLGDEAVAAVESMQRCERSAARFNAFVASRDPDPIPEGERIGGADLRMQFALRC